MENIIDDLTLLERIDKGGCINIFLSFKQGIPDKYATKVINKKEYFKNEIVKEYLYNELSILKDIHHPNLLKLIEVKESPQNLYIITEYYNGGNLSDYLKRYIIENNKPFSEDIVQYIMRQIIEGMKYLHNKKIVHRDMKIDNIMIHYEDENDRISNNIMKGKMKIIDFGFAKYLKKGEKAKTIIGSPINMDPIILNRLNRVPEYKNKGYDKKIDIWSLGTSFYELLTGNSAFDSGSMNELLEKVNKGDYFVPTTLSKEAISFLNCMLQYDPEKRLSIEKLYNHKFLKKNVKEFNKIDLNELKLKNVSLTDDFKIKINTKNNELISTYFGNGIEDDF